MISGRVQVSRELQENVGSLWDFVGSEQGFGRHYQLQMMILCVQYEKLVVTSVLTLACFWENERRD